MPLGMLGKYERLDVLGHGVSGIVYLARDTLLNKQVALKEVDVQAGDVRRFLEEARVMDRLRHPNIVRVDSVDKIDGKIVIAMEYVRGDNLQDLLRAEGRLPVERALDIVAQVLDALDYAHRLQIIHRDIKPANILISREGQVKLVDFGLAEILATNAYAGGAGTYAYMAPEDFAEEERSDNQSDIWAVGVTLYEMLTGHRPFQVTRVKDPFAWKRVLETEAPTPLSAYLSGPSLALQAVLDRALARDKRARYQTAGAFRDDVLRLRAGENLNTGLKPRAEIQSPPSRATPFKEVSRPLFSWEEAPVVPPLVAPPRVGPGMVVADVSGKNGAEPVADLEEAAPARPARRPFSSRKVEARLSVDPSRVDFGSVHKGELRSVKLQARIQGGTERPHGRVLHEPGWLTVHPAAFDRARQTITLTAHSARVWETGEFEETVRIETNAGSAEIPVRIAVRKPRPSFVQVAAWYVPLFIAALLPALSIAFGGGNVSALTLAAMVPSAALASGLLASMLLLIGIAADIGLGERLACIIVILSMGLVLGITARHASSGNLQHAFLLGSILGLVLLLQLFFLPRWKIWAVVLFCLSLAVGGGFLHTLLRF
ncbi:MAG TPA: serine/threonine-protein kinase [Chthonomonadaceae bacterium]|nr:serine/threonine-protein kinase [Chthonomonadaceae bacterium]